MYRRYGPSPISRRAFLQGSGIALLMTSLPAIGLIPTAITRAALLEFANYGEGSYDDKAYPATALATLFLPLVMKG